MSRSRRLTLRRIHPPALLAASSPTASLNRDVDVTVLMAVHNDERLGERGSDCASMSSRRTTSTRFVIDDGSVGARAQPGLPVSLNRGIKAARPRFVSCAPAPTTK